MSVKNVAVELPGWLVDTFPVVVDEPFTVFAVDGVVKSDHPDFPVFGSVSEAFSVFDFADIPFVFDSSLEGVEGSFVFGEGTFYVLNEASTSPNRLLMSHPVKNRIEDLREIYAEWLNDVVPAYVADSTDFMKSYDFVNNHPAFWLKSSGPASWETDYGCGQVDVSAYMYDGKPVVLLETGMHIAPDFTSRYLDTDIVSHASTFEEAYVLLASKVFAHYNLDGTSKK